MSAMRLVAAILVSTAAAGWLPAASASGASPTVTLTLTPTSIVADGKSTSEALATAARADGAPATGATVRFAASDSGIYFGPTENHHNGTYTSTIISSTIPGQVLITVTADIGRHTVSATATLTQTPPTTGSRPPPPPAPPSPTSTTTLVAVPDAAITNQTVTLFALTMSSDSSVQPVGTITFENRRIPITGCSDEPATTSPSSSQSVTATCETSFGAFASPAELTAVFTPQAGSTVGGSTSQPASLPIDRAATSTSLDVSNPTITAGGTGTYMATIAPNTPGSFDPSGTVEFLDRAQPIASCASRRLTRSGALFAATCSVSYNTPGPHSITAIYGGDGNFEGSASQSQPVSVVRLPPTVLGTIEPTMQWTFAYTPAYTKVLVLLLSKTPVGARVLLTCHGRGCTFRTAASTVTAKRCARGTQKCPAQTLETVNLLPRLRGDRLYSRTSITVSVTRPNRIGKYYLFTMRAGRAPRVQIVCLAPGASHPGVRC